MPTSTTQHAGSGPFRFGVVRGLHSPLVVGARTAPCERLPSFPATAAITTVHRRGERLRFAGISGIPLQFRTNVSSTGAKSGTGGGVTFAAWARVRFFQQRVRPSAEGNGFRKNTIATRDIRTAGPPLRPGSPSLSPPIPHRRTKSRWREVRRRKRHGEKNRPPGQAAVPDSSDVSIPRIAVAPGSLVVNITGCAMNSSKPWSGPWATDCSLAAGEGVPTPGQDVSAQSGRCVVAGRNCWSVFEIEAPSGRVRSTKEGPEDVRPDFPPGESLASGVELCRADFFGGHAAGERGQLSARGSVRFWFRPLASRPFSSFGQSPPGQAPPSPK